MDDNMHECWLVGPPASVHHEKNVPGVLHATWRSMRRLVVSGACVRCFARSGQPWANLCN